eukprot:m.308792 g.308792  ORF g.308792 m.308792 type:complete len:88 (+) comp20193_c0_seq1:298-561(+)
MCAWVYMCAWMHVSFALFGVVGPQREVLFAPAVGVAGVAAGNTLVFGPQIHPTSGAAWQSQPGYKYRVTVSTKTQKIEYEFGVLTCE